MPRGDRSASRPRGAQRRRRTGGARARGAKSPSAGRMSRPVSSQKYSPLPPSSGSMRHTTATSTSTGQSESQHISRHHGLSRIGSRTLRDVAVARLKGWVRAVVLRRTLAQRGKLTARIAAVLKWEHCLRQVRIRAAKRTLRKAFDDLAAARHGVCESTFQNSEAFPFTCIAAFLRARHSGFVLAGLRRARLRATVLCLENAWLRCPLFAHLHCHSIEDRVQRLLVIQEDIERRDIVRVHLAFLVACHQCCYNDKILMDAGEPAVRRLRPWEHVVMDDDPRPHDTDGEVVEGDAKELCPGMRPRYHSAKGQRWGSLSFPSIVEQMYRVIEAEENILAAAEAKHTSAAAMKSSSELRLAKEAEREKEFFNKRKRMRLRRADLAFLQLLQLNCGHIDFPSSMGARAPSFDSVPSYEGIGSTVCSADAWRLQNRWSVIDTDETRHVWVADLLLRDEVRDMTLFAEVLARQQARRQSGQDQTTALIYGTHVDVVNEKFLRPVQDASAAVASGKRVLTPQDHTVSPASMGREWTELYRDIDLHDADMSAYELLTGSKVMKRSAGMRVPSVWRNSGYFNMGCVGRVSLDNLISSSSCAKSTRGVSKSSISSASTRVTGGSEIFARPSSTCHFRSEFDIRYEVERLLICEYHHRARIKRDCDVVNTTIRHLLRRSPGSVASKAPKNGDGPFPKGMTTPVKSRGVFD